jgi:2'-5' RNA ligase
MDGSGPGAGRRSQLVVVAIPAESDPVWSVSSEKVPHMTLLYLGEDVSISDVDVQHVTEHVEYASTLLTRIGMDVDRRGTLGPQEADVLFFNKGYDWKKLVQFRHNLLADNVTSKLYHSATQFPEWVPHLTLGFPDKPAKKDTRDYPGFSWINFDRIALWTENSAGPTFVLKEGNYGMDTAMAQSQGSAIAEEVLEHYGVKGMKWGAHKGSSSSVPAGTTRVTQNKKGQLVGQGGRKIPPHSDAINKVHVQTAAKGSGLHALSNKDIQDAVTRMNLEQQFVRLSPQSKKQKAKKFVAETLLGIGKQQISQAANNAASQQVASVLSKAKK